MTREACRIFLSLPDDDYIAQSAPEKVEFPGSDSSGTELRLGDPQGSAGIAGYDQGMGGLATNRDYNPEYRPALARGSYRNHGLYHQAYLESPAYQRAVRNIVEGLTTGHWSVQPYDDTEESKAIAEECQRVLFGLDGGGRDMSRKRYPS